MRHWIRLLGGCFHILGILGIFSLAGPAAAVEEADVQEVHKPEPVSGYQEQRLTISDLGLIQGSLDRALGQFTPDTIDWSKVPSEELRPEARQIYERVYKRFYARTWKTPITQDLVLLKRLLQGPAEGAGGPYDNGYGLGLLKGSVDAMSASPFQPEEVDWGWAGQASPQERPTYKTGYQAGYQEGYRNQQRPCAAPLVLPGDGQDGH